MISEKENEEENIEYKRSLDIKKIVQSEAAFANAKGGTIFIGIENDGNVVGIDVGKNTIERLSNEIVRNTDPKQYPSITVQWKNGKEIIQIVVEESLNKPVLAYNIGYKRVGKSNHKLSRDELIKLSRESRPYYWDEQICNVEISEIDENKVRSFLVKASSERRMDIDANLTVTDALGKLKLLENGRLTNAALLLFSRDAQGYFGQSEVKCARFKGNDTTLFIDVREIKGSIIEQIPNVIKFITENIKLSARIEGIERIEEWEYPIEGLREALVNAICHRDYEDPGNVQVRIFDDRVEVWSPGLLPEGITPKMLEVSHRSIPRNRLIADCFFLIKYIEKWGTGTNRIITECKKHGLPKPKFEERAKSFVVIFPKMTKEYLTSLGLNVRQIKAVEYMKEKNRITNKEYMKLNEVSRNTASSELMELVEKGVLRQSGKGRGSFYEFQ